MLKISFDSQAPCSTETIGLPNTNPTKDFSVCSKGIIDIWVLNQKYGKTPQIIHFNRVFHYKPSILGYPYFWKHPYIYIYICHNCKWDQAVCFFVHYCHRKMGFRVLYWMIWFRGMDINGLISKQSVAMAPGRLEHQFQPKLGTFYHPFKKVKPATPAQR